MSATSPTATSLPSAPAPSLAQMSKSASKRGSLFKDSFVNFLFGAGSTGREDISEALVKNKSLLTRADMDLVHDLLDHDQGHLFEHWEDLGTNDEEKLAMLGQLRKLDEGYNGGIKAYLIRSRELLAASRDGVNTLDGYVPSVPEGVSIDPTRDLTSYLDYEARGMNELSKCCFVLVAGGLGERLGFSGIKVALPSETLTTKCYLQLYVETLLALQKQHGTPGKEHALPLAIMVSDDTEEKTRQLLLENNNFGAYDDQITLMKQEKVPALIDSEAHIALDGFYGVQSKPHGHGDVHVLLHKHGIAKKWLDQGRKWVVFFQDTNGLAFLSLAAALGVSANMNLEVNSIAVPRAAKQEVGAIARLTHADGRVITTNVEYNQLEPLLKAAGESGGDVADPKTGLSPFPGNINQLIFELGPYVNTLVRTNGVMPEFVNPKYADSTKSKFSKPTRLECMMQDYPKLLDARARVGFTQAPAWLAFSPCKNSIEKARSSIAKNSPGACAATAEADQYEAGRKLLRIVGCAVQEGPETKFDGVPVRLSPSVVLAPSFATTLTQLQRKFPNPRAVNLSATSALVIEGDVTVNAMNLVGVGVFRAMADSQMVVDVANLKNSGVQFVPLAQNSSAEESLKIRGYNRKIAVDSSRYLRMANTGEVVHINTDEELGEDGACSCSVM